MERKRIGLLLKQDKSIRQIAVCLGRSASTISRELKRGLTCTTSEVLRMPDKTHKSLHTTLITTSQPFYESLTAQWLYKQRVKNSHKKHKMTYGVQRTVINSLKRGLSPELLCGRLELETGIKLHNETIYRFIYSDDYEYLNLYLCKFC
jgi:IS30 family transposase